MLPSPPISNRAWWNDPRVLFTLGAVVFGAMAVLGWYKLPLGVSVMDEGLAMTDGWRLSAGDRLFPDSSVNAVWMYAVFNAVVFDRVPDITLLGFRQLQYILTLCSTLLLGIAVYRWTRIYWPLPLVFSLFPFTGLDTAGMISNLTYYTYPHLLLTLHLALFLLALKSVAKPARWTLLMTSGLFLWSVGFAVLPLSVTAVGPLLAWLVIQRLGWREPGFSVRDLCLVLAPVALLWLVFLSLNYRPFTEAALTMLNASRNYAPHPHMGLSRIVQYTLVTTLCSGLIWVAIRLKSRFMILLGGIFGLLMGAIITTSGFGLIPPYRFGEFKEITWFSSFLAVALVLLTGRLLYRLSGRGSETPGDVLAWLLMIPSAVLVTAFSISSQQGFLTFAYVAIPLTVAVATGLLGWSTRLYPRPRSAQFLLLVAVLAPFYISTAKADWRLTFFDAQPSDLTTTIHHGFLKGIRTTSSNAAMFAWIEQVTDRFSEPDDYVLSYNWSPMVNIVSKRRPPMNHSWVNLGNEILISGMAYMTDHGRQPKLAFRFGSTTGHRGIRPLDEFLLQNMRLLDRFDPQGKDIFCFIRDQPPS